ncbi:MAG: tRNA 2-thiouridine(34) synthase MnmA [Candidatus Izemoplasmatales bacterium]|jgi:tRNA-specific 2-thiouridylase|nr:tRNA 2-thiouridine(34) synthase MnmA [Candidatus Izemoplasmatales bacterium]
MAKVIIGLSGGVDSSVSAFLLQQQGYEVEGLYMRNWDSALNHDLLGNPDVNDLVCPQEQDYLDAVAVATHLGIKLHRHDFITEYWDDVFKFFIAEYRKYRTPNPDILCNKYIKFNAFSKVANMLGADYIAMGHYANTRYENGETWLLRGTDHDKDQTYFLCQLTQEQLRNVIFPVGMLTKSEVRAIATKNNLITANKKNSTGICFIGERRFHQFLSNYLPASPGLMKDTEGKIIGNHDGLMYYTIGQRKGLGIGGHKDFDNAPWFVVGKDIINNILTVGQGFHHPDLYSNSCLVEEVNWIPNTPFSDNLDCTAKFRYRQIDVPVTLSWIDKHRIKVQYPNTVRAVTPGQAAVFYQGPICLGGGTIDQVFMDEKKRNY